MEFEGTYVRRVYDVASCDEKKRSGTAFEILAELSCSCRGCFGVVEKGGKPHCVEVYNYIN
jgi:hypothetical protein